ncbi:MAG: FxLYD domain-containing protein [Halalkalicoccus sp.]|nr:FxLYD domain-containing protein [Halalkalicoccus sp.]
MGRYEGIGRRRFVALGAGGLFGLAGCLGSGSSGQPAYESGDVPDDINGSARNTSEMATAQAAAGTTPRDELAPLEGLTITDHEFVFESGYTGSTVRGTAENTGSTRISSAEVRVRVYNGDGQQLGLYLASTTDLDAGEEWSFQVLLLEAPSDIADYDIASVGLPD